MSASNAKRIALPAGPILALFAGYLMYSTGTDPAAAITLGITVICVVWWVFEPIPIPATSVRLRAR